MLERTVVLPAADNDGVSLARQVGAVKREVLAITGGYSISSQLSAWRGDDGRVYHDVSTRLVTTVTPEQDQAIQSRLPVWCARLRQVCLYTDTREVQAAFVGSVIHAA